MPSDGFVSKFKTKFNVKKNRECKCDSSKISPKMYIIIPALTCLLSFVIIIPIGVTLYNEQNVEEERKLADVGKIYSSFIREEMIFFSQNGANLQQVYNVKPNLQRFEHEIIANSLLKVKIGIQALARIKRVQHENRHQEEQEASQYYNKTLFFKDFFTNVVVPNATEYYSITLTTPYKGNEAAILLNVISGPAGDLLLRSVETGQVTITSGFKLLQESGDQTGVILFYPTYIGYPQNTTERKLLNTGLIEIVLRFEDWLKVVMSNVILENVIVSVVDNRDQKILASLDGSTGSWIRVILNHIPDRNVRNVITVVQTNWTIYVSPNGDIVEKDYYIVFAAGIPVIFVLTVVTFLGAWNWKKIIDQKSLMIDNEKTANESKQRFIHYVFHEIRVPFQTIKLGILNLKTYLSQASALQTWAAINGCIDHANHILNDMLDVGKMESGKFRLNKSPSFLSNSLKLVLEGFKMSIEEQGKEFIVNIDHSLSDKLLTIDTNRVVQCLSNFLSNANKFCFEGSITLTVSVIDRIYEDDSEIWTVKFCVSDTGIGIPEADKTKLFKPYQQIKNKSKEIGTGLGLVITKNIAEFHGGEVGFESKENVGSTFWFTIPAEVQDCKNIDIEILDSCAEIPREVFEKSILIVDDNKQNCTAFVEFMKNLGFRDIKFAYDGLEALEKLSSSGPFDIVFMDLHMPKMNGLQCVSEIRKIYNNTLYVIMLTGAYIEEQKLLNAGADDILQKPLDVNKLKKKLSLFAHLNTKII